VVTALAAAATAAVTAVVAKKLATADCLQYTMYVTGCCMKLVPLAIAGKYHHHHHHHQQQHHLSVTI